MSTATQGRAVEHAVRHDLEASGYDVVRAAGSKGPADLVAFCAWQVLFLNVKKTTPPGPTERADLLRIAAHIPGVAVPLVALGPASNIRYRRLTGVGPREWEPWTPDEIGDMA